MSWIKFAVQILCATVFVTVVMLLVRATSTRNPPETAAKVTAPVAPVAQHTSDQAAASFLSIGRALRPDLVLVSFQASPKEGGYITLDGKCHFTTLDGGVAVDTSRLCDLLYRAVASDWAKGQVAAHADGGL